jgi:hypothetical protein
MPRLTGYRFPPSAEPESRNGKTLRKMFGLIPLLKITLFPRNYVVPDRK